MRKLVELSTAVLPNAAGVERGVKGQAFLHAFHPM